MNTEEQFRNWCGKHEFAELEERTWGENNLSDATWNDMDGPNDGQGSLIVKPKTPAFDNMRTRKFTVRGWR